MRQMGEQNELNDPTMRKYPLRAKVVVKKAYSQQGIMGSQSEHSVVLLVPTESDWTTRFYMAWLPDMSNERFEIVMEMQAPIYGVCRGAVMRSGRFYDRPHIFVMSKGVEEILEKKNGEYIEFTVLPCADDILGDMAPDTAADITPVVI